MRQRPFYSPEPRWLSLVRQLLGLLTIAAVAVTVAAMSLSWALEREHGAVVIAPDSSFSLPVYPVCDSGPVRWFPVRRVPVTSLP